MYQIFILMLLPVLAISSPLNSTDEPMLHWIKKDAKAWHDGMISDSDFIHYIKWAVEKKIIPIKHVTHTGNATQNIPPELKNIAYYWSIGKISDSDFKDTIRHLIENGAIKMNDDFVHSMKQEIDKVSVVNDTKKSAVIVPVLTSSAYSEKGFYAHYRKECAGCLTVKIRDTMSSFMDSENGVKVLSSLGYHTITDVDIDKNPKILNQYDKIIVLHNEYVTQREFDAITNHPHVIYLYPNALYAKVSINYWNDTVTLVRGHGYPDSSIKNGFGWKFDNSKFEYDRECKNWHFDVIQNGIMLNCYPEWRLGYDIPLLQVLKDF